LALKLLKSFELAPTSTAPNSSSGSTKKAMSRGNSEQRPDYMRHQRKLSNTLRLVQAADDGKEPPSSQPPTSKQTIANGTFSFLYLYLFFCLPVASINYKEFHEQIP